MAAHLHQCSSVGTADSRLACLAVALEQDVYFAAVRILLVAHHTVALHMQVAQAGSAYPGRHIAAAGACHTKAAVAAAAAAAVVAGLAVGLDTHSLQLAVLPQGIVRLLVAGRRVQSSLQLQTRRPVPHMHASSSLPLQGFGQLVVIARMRHPDHTVHLRGPVARPASKVAEDSPSSRLLILPTCYLSLLLAVERILLLSGMPPDLG